MDEKGNTAFTLEDGKSLIEEYEDLLVRREHLIKVSGSYQICYTKEFGDLLTANFEIKIECIKLKKTISYCRRRLNHGLPIETAHMKDAIEKEMTLYYEELKDMVRDTEVAKKSKGTGEFRFNRAKKIYRRLTKLLHPDINRKTMENEVLRDLWEKIMTAYRQSNVDELEDLEVLVRKTLLELGDAGFEIDCSDIEGKIKRVEMQINDILTAEPYTYGELLSSEERIEAHKNRLKDEHDSYSDYMESLKGMLNEILSSSGTKMSFVWTQG